MRIRLALVLLVVGVGTAVAIVLSRGQITVRTISEGSITYVGMARDSGKGSPQFPAQLGRVSSWDSSGKGTIYLTFHFPVALPSQSFADTEERRHSSTKAYILATDGDRFPLQIYAGEADRRYGYVVIPKFSKLDPDHIDVGLDSLGYRSSVVRVSLPSESPAEQRPAKSTLTDGQLTIEARGLSQRARDGIAFPHLGAAIHLSGRDPKAKYQWKDVRIDAPDHSYPWLVGGATVSSLERDDANSTIALSQPEPFAGLARTIWISGTLIERKSLAVLSGGKSIASGSQVRSIPFRLLAPVYVVKSASLGKGAYGCIGSTISDIWPQTN